MFARWRERARLRAEAEQDRLERLAALRERWRDKDATQSIVGVADALGKALDRTFQIESKLLEQMGGFLGVLEEASAKKAASVLGARGGRARAEKQKKLPKPPACPLCANPTRRDVTVEMVNEHRKHEPLDDHDMPN